MPVAAAVTVGFFSCARRMASLNVSRTTGAGVVCADARLAVSASAPNVSARAVRLRDTTPPQALDDDIQNGNEPEVQKRRRDHAARHRRADRVTRLASGAARD